MVWVVLQFQISEYNLDTAEYLKCYSKYVRLFYIMHFSHIALKYWPVTSIENVVFEQP